LTIWFAAGGSGGHLYPALSVAEALRRRVPDVRCAFLTSGKAIDGQIVGADWVRYPVDVRPVGGSPAAWHACALSLLRERSRMGVFVRQSPPDVLFAAGGIHTIPVVVQCQRAGVPTVLFNPDAAAGRANRMLARWVRRVFVQWPVSIATFPAACRVEVTGCPVRPAFGRLQRGDAHRALGLDPSRRTLLVTGASQGASSLNRLVVSLTDFLVARRSTWQVLHVAGAADEALVRTAFERAGIPGRVIAYTEKMAEATTAADLVLTRAGASTLAELAAAGRASILLPYPYGRDRHQYRNAAVFVGAGAARMVVDRVDPALTRPELVRCLEHLMADDDVRSRMGHAAHALARPDAAATIAESLLNMAAARPRAPAPDCMEETCIATR